MTRHLGLLLIAAALAVAACADPPEARIEPMRVLLTGEIDLPDEFFDEFADEQGIPVAVSVDDGPESALDAVRVSPQRPVADIVIGIPDVVLLDRPDAPIERTLPASVTPAFPGVPNRDGLAPLSLLDMCLVWDRESLAAADLLPPSGIGTLAEAEYVGQLVVPDPETTLEGRLFLESLRTGFGDDPETGWVPTAAALLQNGMVVAESWRAAFDRLFVSEARPDGSAVIWAGASLPAVAVSLIDPLPSTSPFGVTTGSGCIRAVVGGVIPMNANHTDRAIEMLERLQEPDMQSLLLDDRGGLPLAPETLPEPYRLFASRPAAPLTALATPEDEPGVTAIWSALVEDLSPTATG